MANNKKKNGTKGLPFPLRMALSAAVKKNTNSEEEREKVMKALDSLDLDTLLHDPEALAKVMSNPGAELMNYVVVNDEEEAPNNDEALEADGAELASAVDTAEPEETNAPEAEESA